MADYPAEMIASSTEIAKEAKPVALVDGLLGDQSQALDFLDKSLGDLLQRIQPVSTPDDDASLAGNPEDCLRASAVALRIDEATRRIRRMTSAVAAAADALEI